MTVAKGDGGFGPDWYWSHTGIGISHTIGYRARGLIIGQLAVRRAFVGATIRAHDSQPLGEDPVHDDRWLVEIIGTPWTLVILKRYDNALIVADEVSRFAVSDLKTAANTAIPGVNSTAIMEAVGRDVARWLGVVESFDDRELLIPSFRTWRATHGQ